MAAMAEAAGFLTEAVQIEPDDPDLLIELAEVEAFRGLLKASDSAFGRALEQIAPQDAGALISAWLRRGRWLRGGVCHPRESRRSYQNALDVLDRDPASDLAARAEALAGMAWAQAVAGDPAAVDDLLAAADRILGSDRAGDLPFFLALMEHLAARGLACPQPVKRKNGPMLGTLAGRPAAIVTFL